MKPRVYPEDNIPFVIGGELAEELAPNGLTWRPREPAREVGATCKACGREVQSGVTICDMCSASPDAPKKRPDQTWLSDLISTKKATNE